jgi:hypothetical protein
MATRNSWETFPNQNLEEESLESVIIFAAL